MTKNPTIQEFEQKIKKLEKKVETFNKVDEALAESETKCQLLLQNLPTIVYRGFKDWSVEFTDDKVELLTGYSREEFNLKKLKWSDLILQEDIESAKESFIEALKNHDSYAREYRVKTKPGDILWIQDRGRITYDKKGDVECIIGTFFDISDRKKVAEELKKRSDQLIQTSKMASLGILTAGVAHELNNPLNNISTSIQILLEELEEGNIEHRRELLLGSEKEIERAKDIVKALLEFSREKTLNLKRVQLKYFVEKTVSLVKGELPSEIRIDMNVPEEIEAKIDPERFQQVLINFILNSMQAITGEGSITISAWEGVEEDRKTLYCQVQDTGQGISMQDFEKIFDPFFTTKDVGKGLGLGLSISHSIIEQHGGRIDVESIPGGKTTFTLRLPSAENRGNSI